MNQINIVMVSDKKYLSQTIVTMTSVLENVNRDYKIQFFLFAYDFTDLPNAFKKLEKNYNCVINCIHTSNHNHYFLNQSQDDFSNKYISFATYHRLLMFKILPNDIENAIYIDSDMIVLCDLSKLSEAFKANDYIFSAVKEIDDVYSPNAHSHLFENKWFNKWEHSHYDAPYFNAGFFICNIKECKKMNVFDLCLKFLSEYKPKLADQDTLNAVFSQFYSEKIQYLDINYNICLDLQFDAYLNGKIYYYTYDQIMSGLNNPYILHFDGKNKPWKNDCSYFATWWKYAKKSKYNFLKIKIKLKLKKFQYTLFPKGSKRRKIVKKILFKNHR